MYVKVKLGGVSKNNAGRSTRKYDPKEILENEGREKGDVIRAPERPFMGISPLQTFTLCPSNTLL